MDDRRYVVRGSWPFPTDMLRRDSARAASPEDAETIALLSQKYAPDIEAIRTPRDVALIGPEWDRWRPDWRRWDSFGWIVVDDPERLADLAERKATTERKDAYRSAMMKLDPAEKAAIEWYAGRRLPSAS